MFNLKPEPVPEDESAKMEELWGQFAKTELNRLHAFEDANSDVKPKTKQEEIHMWEDWASGRYI